MASTVENVQGLGLLAILGAGLFLLYRITQGSTPGTGACDSLSGLPKFLCGLGLWTTGANFDGTFGTPDSQPVQMDYCPTLGTNIPAGLTCPEPVTTTDPYQHTIDPVQCSPGFSWCEAQGHCVADYLVNTRYCEIGYQDPATAPIQVLPVRQVNDMCYYQGIPVLNVPPGTDCHDAITVMCDRFGPGTWNGKNWCGMVT